MERVGFFRKKLVVKLINDFQKLTKVRYDVANYQVERILKIPIKYFYERISFNWMLFPMK